TDNCDGAVAVTRTDVTGLNSGDLFPEGVTTISYEATDSEGNTSTCSFTVTVEDTEPPVVVCPSDPVVDADPGECYYTVSGTEFDPVTATDNCGIASVSNDLNGLATLAGEQVTNGMTIIWTVTDAAGLTAQCSMNITVKALPSDPGPITASDDEVCEGQTGVTYSIDPVDKATSYIWTVPSGATIIGLSDGTSIAVDYPAGATSGLVTVTAENSCGLSAGSSEFAVTVHPLPVVTLTSSDADNIICEGETVTFTATGGIQYEFFVNGVSVQGPDVKDTFTTDMLSNLDAISVVVTDANGCSQASADMVITVNELPAGNITDLIPVACYGESTGSVTVEADPAYGQSPYLYSLDGGTFETSGVFGNLAAGDYTITILDDNGCQAEVPVQITQPASAVSASITGQTDVLCHGETNGTVTIQGEGGTSPYEYSIDGGVNWQTEGTFSSLAAGDYTVTVRDDNFCIYDLFITVSEPEVLTVTVSSTDVTCYGDGDGTATVTAAGGTSPYTYSWSDGQTTPTATGLGPGDYTVTVMDDHGCTVTETVTISEPLPIETNPDITPASCPGIDDGAVTLNISGGIPPYAILWSNNATTEYLVDIAGGTYTVTITDMNNCELFETIEIPYQQLSCLRIPTVFTPNGDNANDLWHIEGIELYPDARIEIFNRWGELVFSTNSGYDNSWDGTYKGRPLPMDSYHFIIDLKNGEAPITGNVTIVR
ncbi:MAG: gliding motility-associated C-terminal domain-containing protein, partial [Bacteroidales bacterium]